MLEKEIIDYWTKRAPSYSEINQKELCGRQKDLWTSYIMRRVQDAMPERTGIKALDIGAGPGFFSIILKMAGCEVTALDRNPAMMAEAKKNAGPLAEGIHYVEGDAEDVPLPADSYDLIVTRNLTWTLPHPKKAYASWQRALYDRDREQVAEAGVFDRYISTDVMACERIARQMPLSPKKRPAWDRQVLEEMGMQVTLHENISGEILLPEEQLNFAATPYFCIEAKK